MPRAGFEFATPATKRHQTYAFDRAATGINCIFIYALYIIYSLLIFFSVFSSRLIHFQSAAFDTAFVLFFLPFVTYSFLFYKSPMCFFLPFFLKLLFSFLFFSSRFNSLTSLTLVPFFSYFLFILWFFLCLCLRPVLGS